MEKSALITGITGQDGAYLANLLLEKGYKVFGTYRRLSSPNFWRLQNLNIYEKINLISADLLDTASLSDAVELSQPDEIYHLAAQSFVGASFKQPIGTGEITGLGVTRILEVIRQKAPKARFYQASTSELFGSMMGLQNETTPFNPVSPYAAAKLYGYWITRIYRETYNIFACNGILFNHESPMRGLEFVTRKISNSVAKISLGLETKLKLGNLDAKRDWGYAPEYVQAMWLMMQEDKPGDFVVATGKSYSVKEFVRKAFEVVDLDWEKYVSVDKEFVRPLETADLCGNNTKAKNVLRWEPKIGFSELVEIMVKEDLFKWQRWLKGERFAWDAPNYPSEDRILSRMAAPDR